MLEFCASLADQVLGPTFTEPPRGIWPKKRWKKGQKKKKNNKGQSSRNRNHPSESSSVKEQDSGSDDSDQEGTGDGLSVEVRTKNAFDALNVELEEANENQAQNHVTSQVIGEFQSSAKGQNAAASKKDEGVELTSAQKPENGTAVRNSIPGPGDFKIPKKEKIGGWNPVQMESRKKKKDEEVDMWSTQLTKKRAMENNATPVQPQASRCTVAPSLPMEVTTSKNVQQPPAPQKVIPLPVLGLMQKFWLFPGCHSCLDKLLVPIPTPFGPIFWRKGANNRHRCLRNLVLSTKPENPLCTLAGFVDNFVSVVRCPLGKTNFDFLMCKQGPLNCPRGDSCHFAHSMEEMEIWNALKNVGITFTNFLDFINCEETVHLHYSQVPVKPAIQSCGTIKQSDIGNDHNLKCSGGTEPNLEGSLDKETPAGSTVGPQTQDGAAQDRFWSCLQSHDIYLACSACYDGNNHSIRRMKHGCRQNLVCCRMAEVKDSPWYMVRSQKQSEHLCENRIPLCPEGDTCKFAHSEVEQFCWNTKGWKLARVVEELKNHLILSSSAETFVLPDSQGHNPYQAILGCKSCSSLVVRSLCTVFFIPAHNCDQSDMFVKNLDTFCNTQVELWLRVKRRPPFKPSTGYDVCRHIEKSCWHGKNCNFAHSKLEQAIWTADARGELSILSICLKLQTRDPQVIMWKDQQMDIITAVEAQVQPSLEPFSNQLPEANGATAAVCRENTGDSITSEAGKDIQECPFRVVYICNPCFKNSNGSLVSYRDRDTCSNKKQHHNWEKNKQAAVKDENNKTHLVREVPKHGFSQRGRMKFYNVKMCNYKMTAGAKQNLVCDSYECTFAHNEWEKKIWMWLIQKGKTVQDVAKDYVPDTLSFSSMNGITAAPLEKSQWNSAEVPQSGGGMSHLTMEGAQADYFCFLCNKTPQSLFQSQQHCQTEQHKLREKIDKQQAWQFKAPASAPPYVLCDRHATDGEARCQKPHSKGELNEWTQRWHYLNKQLNLNLTSEHSKLLERVSRMTKKIGTEDVDIDMEPPESTQSVDEKCSAEWTFYHYSEEPLVHVALVKTESMNYFRFVSPLDGERRLENDQGDGIFLVSGSEFEYGGVDGFYQIKLQFIGAPSNKTYGTEVAFDFGAARELVFQKLVVHSGLQIEELERLSEIIQLLPEKDDLWNSATADIVWISRHPRVHPSLNVDPNEVIQNLQMRVIPDNYCRLMEKWLTAEQQARQGILASFRICAEALIDVDLHWSQKSIRAPIGRQYAMLQVDSPLSDDVDLTSLLMADCDYAFVSPVPPVVGVDGKIRVFEAELLGKHNSGFDFKGVTQNQVFLLLSGSLTRLINKLPGQKTKFTVQFNISAKQFDQWRDSVEWLDRTKNTEMVFPDLNKLYHKWYRNSYNWWSITDSSSTCSSIGWVDIKLNREQKLLVHHVVHARCSERVFVPPLVVFGPFGTGKTQTMAFAVTEILLGAGGWTEKDGLILICTHSHPTADMYLELIEQMARHKMTRDELRQKMIRLFPRRGRTIESLPDSVKPYVPVEQDGSLMELSSEEIQVARIVVCTLSGSHRLLQLSMGGHKLKLSHLFLDEAAQSLEAETLMPLCLASRNTRVVVAGDHNQIRPKVYLGSVAAELSFSYLERLYHHYDKADSQLMPDARKEYKVPKLLFNRNYRCHKGILEFVSAEFYGKENSLVACRNSPITKISPLNYAAVDQSMEEQLPESTSWCNMGEAKMVASRVEYLCNNWPQEWGEIQIGVAVAYHDQIGIVKDALWQAHRSRGFLTKEMIRNNIDVGKVISMQGKEFKAMVISVVLTRSILTTDYRNRNLGFLDDEKLINTALTRAIYSVIVVGDPVALCGIGQCSGMWQRYIQRCEKTEGGVYPANRNWKSIEHELKGISLDLEPGDQKNSVGDQQLSRDLVKRLDMDKLVQQLVEKTEEEQLRMLIESPVARCCEPVTKLEENDSRTEDSKESSVVSETSSEAAVLHIVASYNIYAAPLDRTKGVIYIRNRKYCCTAFSGDHVLMEVTDVTDGKRYGRVTEIIQRLFNPEKRLFACFADPKALGMMIPVDPKIPKLHTRTKKSKKGGTKLVRYQVWYDSKLEEAEEIPINRVNCKENIFIVMYIRWEKENFCPYGMIVDKVPLVTDKNEVKKMKEQGMSIVNVNHNVEDLHWSLDCHRRMEQIIKTFETKPKNANRLDLRKVCCFTIDPPGSLDLDDALSIESIDEEICEVGIHIADVSAVVEKEDAIDQEAKERGETLYSANLDDPKHMLPNQLSTDFLSLLPGKDKMTVSVLVHVNWKTAEIKGVRIKRSCISSNRQLTYAEAEKMMNAADAPDSKIVSDLLALHQLAWKLKVNRLGLGRALSQDVSHLEYPKSELLVSEWMILTNHLVARELSLMYPEHVLIRKQLPPPEQLLCEWQVKCHSVLQFSFKYSSYFLGEPSLMSTYSLPHWLWEKVTTTKLMEEKKMLLGMEDLHPCLVPADVAMRMIQERSFYTPAKEAMGFLSHHQLNLQIYTHFTSPIRRYIDVVVHRMLLSGLEGQLCPYSVHELKEICDHCTEVSRKGRDYEQQCYNLKIAIENQAKPVVLLAFVHKIGDLEVHLEFPAMEKKVDSLKSLKYSLLELFRNPKIEDGSITLTWKKELYSLSLASQGSLKSKRECIWIPSQLYSTQIPVPLWNNIRQCLYNSDDDGLKEVLIEAEKTARNYAQPPDLISEPSSTKIIQKRHTEFGIVWKEASILKVQLSAGCNRGVLIPSVQLVHLTQDVRLCMEHMRDPSGCFAIRPEKVVQMKYKGVFDCQKTWLQILMMEYAQGLVAARESVTVHHVPVNLSHHFEVIIDKNKKPQKLLRVQATFNLSKDFCFKRMIHLSTWSEKGTVDPRLMKISRLDCFCIQIPMKDYVWVGHFVSKNIEVDINKTNEKDEFYRVECSLIHSGSAIPKEFLAKKGTKHSSVVEIFIASDPEKRMQQALCGLSTAAQLIQEIAIGKCSITSKCGASPDRRKEIERLLKHIKTDLPSLNKYQKEAIMTSLSQPFTVIWGPPGTGKTVTAVRLACCFAKENRSTDCSADNLSAFPKLLYVAPSNKAVNVVGKLFKRIIRQDKSLRVVRVYAKELEVVEFPLPFDRVSKKNIVDLEPELRDISLHHLIRDSRNTQNAVKILEYDMAFAKIREEMTTAEGPKETGPEILDMMKKYKYLVKWAERDVMMKCDILLCTCTAANEHRLHFLQSDSESKKPKFIVNQVILDEASMSCEPESLIPLVATNCETVVLVGDHKQLSPVVLCNEAREFGMDSTLFSKYVANAVMLQSQYRMHESIAEFPSNQFYEGKLELGKPMEQMKSNPVWPFWKDRIAFCHCEGVEERRVVTTDDACEMSASNKAEVHHVLRIVRGLVSEKGVQPGQIAILSQYRAQINLITENLNEPENKADLNGVNVQTVIKSQGGEWDYVVFTTVRSMTVPEIDPNPSLAWVQKNLGSIADEHQICVALTRAKQGLVIIGNANLLGVDDTWKELIHHYKGKKCLIEDVASFMSG